MANEPQIGSFIICGVKPNADVNGQLIPCKVTVDDSFTPPRLVVELPDSALRDLGKVDIAEIAAGDNSIGRVKITDGTDVALISASGELSVALGSLPAYVTSTGTITATDGSVTIALGGRGGVSATLSGTWSANIIAEVSGDGGTTWDQTDLFLRSVGTVQFAVGSNGVYTLPWTGGGMTHARIRALAYTSGTVNVHLTASIAPMEVSDKFTQGAAGPVPANAVQLGIQGPSGETRYVLGDASGNLFVTGSVADDATTPAAPVMIGGQAKSPDGTDPGNVSAENDVARATFDLNRRQYVNDDHPNHWSYHENSSSALTDQEVKADPGDGFQIVITEIDFSTGGATAASIFFEEGATTILGPFYLEAVAGRGLFWRGRKFVTASTALTVTTTGAVVHGLDVRGFVQKV